MIEKIKSIKISKKILAGVFLLIVVIGYFFYKRNSGAKQNYQTAKVTRETLIETVSASGQIVSSSSFPVLTQASGVVKTVYVTNGQMVKKGDKILEIDLDQNGLQRQTAAWSNYLAAKNNLDQAQANLYSLQSDMFDKWNKFYQLATNSTYQNPDGTPNYTNRALPEFHIAEKNWLAAEANYKNQQNKVTQAQTALQDAWLSYQMTASTVVAPTDGEIADLIYAPGMVIFSTQSTSSGTKVATIKKPGKPFGQFNASEIDVAKIKPGQKATITIDALPGKTYTGQVIAVDKTGVVTSSVVNYPLTVEFDTEVEEVLPNMSATVNIIVNKKTDVLTVPSTAIVLQGESSYVRVLKDKKIILVPVETGIASDAKTEIVSGLNEGDEVVTAIINTNQRNTQSTSSPFSGFGAGGGVRIRTR